MDIRLDTKSHSATEELSHFLLTQAIEKRASDVHVRPLGDEAEVRLRIDGVLQRVGTLPSEVAVRLVRHVKAQSGLEPTLSNRPQDGRASATHDGHHFDLRVSTLPAKGGESLVVRLLEQGRVFGLDNSGMNDKALCLVRDLLDRPSGLVLMTGPTGSGKSTTLFSMLQEINRPEINIQSVEDPVEYVVPGVTQVEVNEKAGLTFPAVIRSCLRQDPDVLLVGEIRDAETAQIALQAALTGHLVLSTLHTNDAATAVPRLIDLGISAAALSDALVAVMAQRLVRKLCTVCGGKGCDECGGTGYRGRLPVVEILEKNKDVAQLIVEGGTAEQIRLANTGPLASLTDYAANLVAEGLTNAEEVRRVVG